MITIKEYLLSKNKNHLKGTKVVDTNEELYDLVRYEIEQNGKDADLNFIDVSHITTMTQMFKDTDFCGNVSDWDMSNVNSAYMMFYNCENFNCDISQWNLSNLETGYYMFYGCDIFDCNVGNWKIKKLENARCMFQMCYEFKGKGIEKWNVKNLRDTQLMFATCRKFNPNISKWNIINIEDARGMFLDCYIFNQDLGNWNIEKLYEAENMFLHCRSFKGKGLDKWNPRKIKSMNSMFEDCPELDVDLHDWLFPCLDLSKAKNVFTGCPNMYTWKKPINWR